MKQKGFTLIEFMVVIAILGVIAAVVVLNVDAFSRRWPNEAATNESADEMVVNNGVIYTELATRPISSLNLTELVFIVDYCMSHPFSEHYAVLATVYQNQIIINGGCP